ncbi:uncharacterized protein ZGC:113184 [Latimeria chalumnae]|uniref:uncharacterized protein ZGC:113184 n=1 Tax=Latimeria chalumnae TaxID=7897 RepID=UPI0006D8E47C|nr:PREDICTED: uncharacterized protein LOC102352441 [Latimeria chalumnae]|eukprot:XP_014348437.1 PREDICTED: uncharacterized protein LOC102352441 [Latimeria chalumnae]
MEEAFVQLYQEFRRLQTVCAKQAELLQKLTIKKQLMNEIPVSRPIQCTESEGLRQSEGPFLRLQGTKAQSPAVYGTSATSSQNFPMSVPECPDDETKLPSDAEHGYNFPNTGLRKPGLDVALGGHKPKAQADSGNKESNATCREAILNVNHINENPKADASLTAAAASDGLKTLFSNHRMELDQFISLYDLYGWPSPGMYSEVLGKPEFLPVAKETASIGEIHGPTQTSWTPGCRPSDCHMSHRGVLNSDVTLNSHTCDFCQAVFPAGAATCTELLRHLTTHVESDSTFSIVSAANPS